MNIFFGAKKVDGNKDYKIVKDSKNVDSSIKEEKNKAIKGSAPNVAKDDKKSKFNPFGGLFTKNTKKNKGAETLAVTGALHEALTKDPDLGNINSSDNIRPSESILGAPKEMDTALNTNDAEGSSLDSTSTKVEVSPKEIAPEEVAIPSGEEELTKAQNERIGLLHQSLHEKFPENRRPALQKLEKVIQLGLVEKFDQYLGEDFPSKFTPEQQQNLIAAALNGGYLAAAKRLVEKGCSISEGDKLRLQNLSGWSQEIAEKKFPVLKAYNSLDRALNPQHLQTYQSMVSSSNINTVKPAEAQQAEYLAESKKNVIHALWVVNQAKESGMDTATSFQCLLSGLGDRRQRIAYLNFSKDAAKFGNKRALLNENPDLYRRNEGFASTPLDNEKYHSYGEQVGQLEDVQMNKISIDNKEYILSRLDPSSKIITHWSSDFWKPGSPLFTHVSSIYGNIVNTDWSENPEGLKNEIASLHWHLANIMPFDRGSASIIENITDALWLMHGFVPLPIEQGKSMDLEALMSNDRGIKFQKNYPMGQKIQNG